jgi:uncharacterized secreted protein with C-terminal beta-propeller domain
MRRVRTPARLVSSARMGTSLHIRGRRRVSGAVALLLVASVDCVGPPAARPLVRFETCEELENFVADRFTNELRPQLGNAFLFGCPSAASDPSAAEGEGDSESLGARDDSDNGGGGRVASETNTQEVGVDEPDVLKNDAGSLFVASGGDVYVVDAWPPEDASQVKRIAGSSFAETLLLARDRLLVIGRDQQAWNSTVLELYDVVNPAEPVLLRETSIEGAFLDARRVGDEVLLVTSSWLTNDANLRGGFFREGHNREALRASGIDGIFPKLRDRVVGVDEEARVEPASACTNTFAATETSRTYDESTLLMIHTYALLDETAPIGATSVIASWSVVYASEESVYLAATEWNDGGYFTPEYTTTRLHKLAAFQGEGAAEYEGTGSFYGAIKDEMSLDEQDGRLRMVISDDGQSTDPEELKTALVILEDEGDSLIEVARVDDIGKGEGVQAVRFIGERAYVVTYPFEDALFIDSGVPSGPYVDPLFVIDLSRPTDPVLRGELEVGGYSTYIHPLDEDHILTIGVETSAETGEYQGMQLSIFDVADADEPKLAHRLGVGGSTTGSEALSERHAFQYFALDKTLAIPIVDFDGPIGRRAGSAIFSVDVDDGIAPRGTLDFAQLQTVEEAWCIQPRRNAFIHDDDRGTFLYAIASSGVVVAALDDLAIEATVAFDGPSECGFVDDGTFE